MYEHTTASSILLIKTSAPKSLAAMSVRILLSSCLRNVSLSINRLWKPQWQTVVFYMVSWGGTGRMPVDIQCILQLIITNKSIRHHSNHEAPDTGASNVPEMSRLWAPISPSVRAGESPFLWRTKAKVPLTCPARWRCDEDYLKEPTPLQGLALFT